VNSAVEVRDTHRGQHRRHHVRQMRGVRVRLRHVHGSSLPPMTAQMARITGIGLSTLCGVTMERERLEWLDRLAIEDLIARYSDAVTRADWDQCEAVFAPDAVWQSPLGLRFESRAAFMEFLRPTSSYDVLIQTSHSSVITFTGPDRAKATTTIELSRGDGLADSKLGETAAEINVEQ
jgi:hypothetical protein